MKKVFLLLLSLIISSCENMNTKIENLWNNIVESSNKEMELANVKKMTKYMSVKGLSFNMTVMDNNTNEYKLPDDFPIDSIFIKKVLLIVYDGDIKVFESGKWEPRDKENLYMFFYE
jgi:hypothetical protein